MVAGGVKERMESEWLPLFWLWWLQSAVRLWENQRAGGDVEGIWAGSPGTVLGICMTLFHSQWTHNWSRMNVKWGPCFWGRLPSQIIHWVKTNIWYFAVHRSAVTSFYGVFSLNESFSTNCQFSYQTWVSSPHGRWDSLMIVERGFRFKWSEQGPSSDAH